jgi:hypothetical protein
VMRGVRVLTGEPKQVVPNRMGDGDETDQGIADL